MNLNYYLAFMGASKLQIKMSKDRIRDAGRKGWRGGDGSTNGGEDEKNACALMWRKIYEQSLIKVMLIKL